MKLNVIKLDCPTLRVGFRGLYAIEHDGDFADELSTEQMWVQQVMWQIPREKFTTFTFLMTNIFKDGQWGTLVYIVKANIKQ